MQLLKLIGRAFSSATGGGEQSKAKTPKTGQSRWLSTDPRANQLLTDGVYCRLLNDPYSWRPDAIWAAAKILENEMAYVPPGTVSLQNISIVDGNTSIAGAQRYAEDSFFIDRNAVTNGQFRKFIEADGYRTEEYWTEDIWPHVGQFIDATGVPGPADWRGGKHHPDKQEHPVVGVSWHEAKAFATWAGKTLPTTTQWQRAGTWWKPSSRFPWGSDFHRQRANTYRTGLGDTAAVNEYDVSSTPYGVRQLVGNVWEWVDNCFSDINFSGQKLQLSQPMGEIRGGAFDTYFPSQATCVYRSGQPTNCRRRNVGFRCAIGSNVLAVITSESTQ